MKYHRIASMANVSVEEEDDFFFRCYIRDVRIDADDSPRIAIVAYRPSDYGDGRYSERGEVDDGA